MKIKRIMPAFFLALLVLSAFTAVSFAAGGIEFTASLKAVETWIPPEGIVNFTVTIENTGTVDIDKFEIIMPDGELVGEYDSLPAGESADVQVKEMVFDNPGEYPVNLFVIGYHGKDSWTVQTSEIIITVSSDPRPASIPEPEPSAAASELRESAEAVTTGAEPTAAAPSGAVVAVADTASETNFIYIVIGVLGALAVAVIISVIVVAVRRKPKQQ